MPHGCRPLASTDTTPGDAPRKRACISAVPAPVTVTTSKPDPLTTGADHTSDPNMSVSVSPTPKFTCRPLASSPTTGTAAELLAVVDAGELNTAGGEPTWPASVPPGFEELHADADAATTATTSHGTGRHARGWYRARPGWQCAVMRRL